MRIDQFRLFGPVFTVFGTYSHEVTVGIDVGGALFPKSFPVGCPAESQEILPIFFPDYRWKGTIIGGVIINDDILDFFYPLWQRDDLSFRFFFLSGQTRLSKRQKAKG